MFFHDICHRNRICEMVCKTRLDVIARLIRECLVFCQWSNLHEIPSLYKPLPLISSLAVTKSTFRISSKSHYQSPRVSCNTSGTNKFAVTRYTITFRSFRSTEHIPGREEKEGLG